MEYDVARAKILLRDLARIGPGHSPGVQFETSPDDAPVIRGTCTRFGLLRMAIHLAQAALSARFTVVVRDDGQVASDGNSVGSLVQVYLADDPPPPAPRPARFEWRAWVGIFLALGFLTLAFIGFITVVRFVIATLGG